MNKYQEAFNKIKEDIEYSHSEMKAFDLESKKQILFIKTASEVCLNTLQEACEKAEKYDEKETPCKPVRIYPPFGDNVPVKRYPKLFGCGICGNQVLKHYKYCPECGNRIERGMNS